MGGLASADLHAVAILFARDDAEHARATGEHDELVARCDGVRRLSFLDLNATPPFNYAHDHFGFRDRLSQPVIEGSGDEPTPGSGAPLKPGEFILGYPDENGPRRRSAAAGSAVPQRKLHGLPAAAGARRAVPRLSSGNRPRRRRTRSCSRRSSWDAGAAARRWCWRRTRTIPELGADPHAQQRLQLQGDGSARICRARSAHTPDASTRATPRTT